MTVPSTVGTISTTGSGLTSDNVSVAVPSGATCMIICFGYFRQNQSGGGAVSSCTYNGVSATLIDKAGDGVNGMTVEIWELKNIPASGSYTLAWSFNGSLTFGATITPIFLQDVDESASIARDFDHALHASSAVTPAFSTDTNDLVLLYASGYAAQDCTANFSPQTEIHEPAAYNSIETIVATKPGTSGTTTVRADGYGVGIVGISIKGTVADQPAEAEMPQIDESYQEDTPIDLYSWLTWQLPDDVVIVDQFWTEMPEIDETYLEEHFYDGLQLVPLSDDEPAIAGSEFPFVDESYEGEQDYAGTAIWQMPENIEDFQALPEFTQVDETYDDEHDYAGIVVWQTPEDVEDFQALVELPQIDQQYDETFGQEVNGLEDWQVPENVEDFQSLAEIPQIDEQYDETYANDFSGFIYWQFGENIEDFQALGEFAQIDETYYEQHDYAGTVVWQAPEDVADFQPLAQLPQIDEQYDEAFTHDFSGSTHWQIGENIENFQSLGEFAQVDETYYEEHDYAGIAVWQPPDDIHDFQALPEFPQIDEHYDNANGHESNGFVYWSAPNDVEDFLLGVAELPEMDDRYSLVEEFFGWQTVVIEEPAVEEPLLLGEFPQMDEQYEHYYEYFGWQYSGMLADVVALYPGAKIIGKKGDQLTGRKSDQVIGVKTRNIR